MANTETTRRRGATPIAGKIKAVPAKSPRNPARAAAREGSGAGAIPARPTAPRRDRFHAVWASGQFAALLGALLCGGVIAYLLSAGAWQIRRLDLAGAALTTPGEIDAAVGVSGHNIFTIEPQAAATRLVALPTVREAEVWGELPDRLVVRIVERQPVMTWQLGEDRYLVDGGGFVIAKNPAGEVTQGLPRLEVRERDSPAVGGRVDATVLSAALTIGEHASKFGVTITSMEYAPALGLTVVTPGGAGATNGRRILLGDGERLGEKLSVAGEIIRSEQNWAVLNVTDPDRPFFPAQQP